MKTTLLSNLYKSTNPVLECYDSKTNECIRFSNIPGTDGYSLFLRELCSKLTTDGDEFNRTVNLYEFCNNNIPLMEKLFPEAQTVSECYNKLTDFINNGISVKEGYNLYKIMKNNPTNIVESKHVSEQVAPEYSNDLMTKLTDLPEGSIIEIRGVNGEVNTAYRKVSTLAGIWVCTKEGTAESKYTTDLVTDYGSDEWLVDYVQMEGLKRTPIKGANTKNIKESLYSTLDLDDIDDIVSGVLNKVKKKDCVITASATYNSDASKIMLFVRLKNGEEHTNAVNLEELDTLEQLHRSVKNKFELMTDVCEGQSHKCYKELNKRLREDSDELFVYKALDINGNPVYKVFYKDGSNRIIKGTEAYERYPREYDKYVTLNALYHAKLPKSLKESSEYDDIFDEWSMSDYVEEGDTIYSDGQDYYITEIKNVKTVDGYELAVVEVNTGANIGADVPKKLVGNQDYYYFVLLNGDVEWGVCDTYEEAKEWYDGVEDGYYEEDDIYQSYHDSSEDELRKMGAFDNLNDALDEGVDAADDKPYVDKIKREIKQYLDSSVFKHDVTSYKVVTDNKSNFRLRDYYVEVLFRHTVPQEIRQSILKRIKEIVKNNQGTNITSGRSTLKDGAAILFNRKKQEYNNDVNGDLHEDTIKRNGKWANVGKDGKADSGKFKTKKEADAQRKAMFANGYRSESLKESAQDNVIYRNSGVEKLVFDDINKELETLRPAHHYAGNYTRIEPYRPFISDRDYWYLEDNFDYSKGSSKQNLILHYKGYKSLTKDRLKAIAQAIKNIGGKYITIKYGQLYFYLDLTKYFEKYNQVKQ